MKQADQVNNEEHGGLLEAARRLDVIEIREALENGARVGAIDSENNGVLLIALRSAVKQKEDYSEKILIDVDQPKARGKWKLNGDKLLDTLNVLLGAGANANERDEFGNSVLFNAIATISDENQGYAVSRLLLAHGSNQDEKGVDDCTALMCAALLGRAGFIRALIESEIEIDARDAFGNTALMHAASKGHKEAALILVNAGAALSCVNHNKMTASALAHAGKDHILGAWLADGLGLESSAKPRNI